MRCVGFDPSWLSCKGRGKSRQIRPWSSVGKGFGHGTNRVLGLQMQQMGISLACAGAHGKVVVKFVDRRKKSGMPHAGTSAGVRPKRLGSPIARPVKQVGILRVVFGKWSRDNGCRPQAAVPMWLSSLSTREKNSSKLVLHTQVPILLAFPASRRLR